MKKTNFQLSLGRTLDLYNPYLLAIPVRDKVSRLYYACYHAAVTAIELKANFVLLRKAESTSYHAALRKIYPRHYGKPNKKNETKIKIVAYKVDDALLKWSELRNVADYIVFDDQFEGENLDRTTGHLDNMESFVKDHLRYFADRHSQRLTAEQAAEIGGILVSPANAETTG